MKKLFLSIILCLISFPLWAQQEQTLIKGKIKSGGFGAPVLKVTGVNGKTVLFTGGRGGWIMRFPSNNSFIIGGGGYGLLTNVKLNGYQNTLGQQLYLDVGYGGLEVEYVHASGKLVHFSVQTLIGAGSALYEDHVSDHTIRDYRHSTFFVWEPGINIITNVTNFMRIGAGIGYRLINGVNLPGTSDKQLSNLSGTVTLKFGKF